LIMLLLGGIFLGGWISGVEVVIAENVGVEKDSNLNYGNLNDELLRSHEEMILIERGEKAGHYVVEDFYLSKYPVTVGEFIELMGFNPSFLPGEVDDFREKFAEYAHHPIEHVTWYDAVKFANKLSEQQGLEPYYNITEIERIGEPENEAEKEQTIIAAEVSKNEAAAGYRLPTLTEHIYAAAGGRKGQATLFPGSNDPDEVAWQMTSVTEDLTQPVGTKAANELGLYDMGGNVFNWTDTADGPRKMARGGGYIFFADLIEVDNPGISHRPETLNSRIGFRLAKNNPEAKENEIEQNNPSDEEEYPLEKVDLLRSHEEMVLVEAGSKADISIEEDFYLSKYPVTVGEFIELMGFNPSFLPGAVDDFRENFAEYVYHPIDHVTWYDAVKFANELSREQGFTPYYNIEVKERAAEPIDFGGTEDNIVAAEVTVNPAGDGFRLPTVEEHMYAAAGGEEGKPTIYAGSNDPEKVAHFDLMPWFQGEEGSITFPVGEKEANELGLYDMSGNVHEWTEGDYGYYRTSPEKSQYPFYTADDNLRSYMRGGSFMVSVDFCEVDNIGVERRKFTYRHYLGFRLAR